MRFEYGIWFANQFKISSLSVSNKLLHEKWIWNSLECDFQFSVIPKTMLSGILVGSWLFMRFEYEKLFHGENYL
jgi:hypothetical protein